MQTIGLCMIVKDEEKVLEGCLKSVANLCDEIIIVDTGSTDNTKNIARRFTENIYDYKWIDDFSAARNFAFSKSTTDYILWLDADDLIDKGELKKLKKLKKELDGTVDAVRMYYHTHFDKSGNPSFRFKRNRLIKRSRNYKWIGAVHEYLDVTGVMMETDIYITHRKNEKEISHEMSSRNLNIYEKRLENKEVFSARDIFYYANELKDHGNYQKAVLYYKAFLRTEEGWVEDEIRACLSMAYCYKQLGSKRREREALALSIQFDLPRPEACCKLGDLFLEEKQYNKATVWYETALNQETFSTEGFVQESYQTWYPHLQLCLCTFYLGDIERAIKHNNIAKIYAPKEPTIQSNDEFLREYIISNK